MPDTQKTKAQLLSELTALRQRVAKLEAVAGTTALVAETSLDQEFRSQDLFEDPKDGVMTFAWDGTIMQVNAGLERLLGWSSAEMIGQHYRRLGTAAAALMTERTRRVLAGAKLSPTFELGLLHKEGRLVPVEIWTRFLHNAAGQPIGFQALVRDLSKRKQAEQVLRQSERLFRTLADTTTAYVFIYQGTQCRYIDKAACHSLGYTQDELLAMPFWAVIRPDYQDQVRQRGLARQAGEAVPDCYEVPLVNKDGTERWVEYTARPIMFEGQPAILGTAFDLTERRQAEEILQTRVRQQTAIAALGQRALASTDFAGLLADVCSSVANTLEAPCCKILELLADGSALRLQAGVGWQDGQVGQATVSTGLDSQAGYTLLSQQPVIVADLRTETRFSGPALLHTHGVVSGISVIIAGHAAPYGVLGVHTTASRTFSPDDVTFLQAAANIVAEVLERRRIEAQKHELQRQLFEAQKLEALGTLARGVAHDFNNILVVVRTFTELAKELVPRQDKTIHDNLSQVLAASGRARDLVQQILTFSRREEPSRSPLPLHELVTNSLSLLRASLPSAVTLHSSIAPAGNVLGNTPQLHQVLMNLCVNAGQAMGEAGGELTVRLQPISVEPAFAASHPPLRSGPHCQLTVSDTGCGMTPEVLEHMFDPLFTTKSADAGTGLGLTIVQEIVAGHGGAMTVDSQPQQGATFSVYLPVVAGQ